MSQEFKAIRGIVLEEVETLGKPSSNIAAIGYDETYQVIETEFLNGRTYQAFGCSKELFEEYKKAESKGKFYHAHIRDQFTIIEVT